MTFFFDPQNLNEEFQRASKFPMVRRLLLLWSTTLASEFGFGTYFGILCKVLGTYKGRFNFLKIQSQSI